MSASNLALSGCVASLRSSMQLLDSSIATLDAGVSDLPRIERVLRPIRHFELVSEAELRSAQESLRAEIAPEVEGLLARVDAYLEKLARRERSLIAKAELQEGRLNKQQSAGMRRSGAGSSGVYQQQRGEMGERTLTAVEEVKVGQLRLKKERLSYAVSRLEMQAGQRERQLRKSMAGPGFGLE